MSGGASAGAIRAGRAYVELGIRDTLDKGLRVASTKLKAFGMSVASIGAKLTAMGSAVTGPILASLWQFTSVGDEIGDTAAKIGIATEALQELRYAAQRSGAESAVLDASLVRLQRNVSMAASGNKAAAEMFRSIGIDPKQLQLLPIEQQLGMVADGLSKVSDHSDRVRIAMTLLGKGGAALLPMLEGGSSGLAGFAAHARELGIIMSDEDVKAAGALDDAMIDLKAQFMAIVVKIGAAVAPAITTLAKAITPLVKSVIEFIDKNRALVAIIAGVAAVVTGLGAALTGLGVAISFIGIGLGGIAPLFKLAFAPVRLIFGVFKLLLNPMRMVNVLTGAWGVALKVIGVAVRLLLSKIFLIPAAIGLVLAAWMKWTKSGQEFKAKLFAVIGQITGKFTEAWGHIKDTFLKSWGGIVDALKAGDLALAGKIAWTGLKLAFFEAINGIKGAWVELQKGMVTLAAATAKSIIGLWSKIKKSFWEAVGGWQTMAPQREYDAAMADLESKRGSMTQREYSDAMQAINDRYQAQMKEVWDATDSRTKAIDDSLRSAQESIDALAGETNAVLDDKYKAGQAELQALREELDALRRKAAEEAGRAEDERYRKEKEEKAAPTPEAILQVKPQATEYSVGAFERAYELGQDVQKAMLDELRAIRKNTEEGILGEAE